MTEWIWIGERGPELLDLPDGAKVIRLSQSPGAEDPEGTP